jgi:hypothetical protein
MNDRTAVPEREIQRAKTARRGSPSGRLVVGEYVGQAAGDAAQAVRRAGLKPGLDRSFGCEAELTGLVVAQEPVAGGDLARNGMVTLYVAAPGNAPPDEDTDAPETVGDPPPSAPAAPVHADVAQAEAPSPPARARRREPGRAGREQQVFDPAPAPVPPGRGAAEEAPTAEIAQVPLAESWGSLEETDAPVDEGLDEGDVEERGEDELLHDEFVVHMDDVLAGRAGGPRVWRRVYPRRPTAGALGGGVRAGLAEHPRLVKAVGAAFAVCAVVGVAATLDGHHARTGAASVISHSELPAGSHTTGVRDRASAPSWRAARPAARPPRTRTPPQRSGVPRHRSAPALVRAAAAPPEGAGVQAAPAPRPAPPAPSASASPPPPAEQTQGGLFSP